MEEKLRLEEHARYKPYVKAISSSFFFFFNFRKAGKKAPKFNRPSPRDLRSDQLNLLTYLISSDRDEPVTASPPCSWQCSIPSILTYKGHLISLSTNMMLPVRENIGKRQGQRIIYPVPCGIGKKKGIKKNLATSTTYTQRTKLYVAVKEQEEEAWIPCY